MSWLFSQALVEEYLEENSLDGEPCAQLNVMPTQHKFSLHDKTIEHSTLSRFGLTLRLLTEQNGEDLLTWYQEASLAKTSPVQARALESAGNEVDCGTTCSESLMKSNQSTPSLKTPRTFVLKDLSPSSKDLPKSGMMLHGVCYPQATVEPITSGSGCGSLLPTPTCAANQLAPSMRKHKGCRELQKMLPTPTCHNAKEGAYPAEGNRNTPTLGWVLGGKPHPNYTEWMMGWPSDHTDLKPLETDKYQSWLQQHSSSLQGS